MRQGLLTSLHKVIYDANSSSLLLFSEYVDEPRFGDQLAEIDLHVDGALALGFLVIRQVAALHEHGMAHNNISPGALLFKGVAATRTVDAGDDRSRRAGDGRRGDGRVIAARSPA